MSNNNTDISSIRNRRCIICLSQDRNLLVLKNLTFLAIICPEISFKPNDKVCWECESMIRKMVKFKQKAIEAQKLLRGGNIKHFQRSSLSSLNIVNLVKISYTQEDALDSREINIDIQQPVYVIKNKADCRQVKIKKEEIKVENRNIFGHVHDESIGSDSEEETKFTEIEFLEEESQLEGVCNGVELEEETLKIEKSDREEEMDSKLTKKSREKAQVKIYNSKKVLVATVERIGEEKLMELRDKERGKKGFMAHKLKCLMCVQKFMSNETYEEHTIRHRPDSGNFICVVCEQRFMSKVVMDKHTKEHYRCYRCVVCADEFRRQADVEYHYYCYHTTRSCEECNIDFQSVREHKKHKMSVHRQIAICTICNRCFKGHYSLRVHMERSHQDTQMLECDICHKKLKGEVGLLGHKKRVHEYKRDEGAYCTECNLQFSTMPIYKRHLKYSAKHRTPDESKYICDACGSKYICKFDLVSHINMVHLKTDEFQCKLCSKLFGNTYKLQRHVSYSHEGLRPPRNKICTYCGRAFTTNTQLTRHIRTHTGERPYKCEVCSMAFAQRSTLKTHIRGVHKHLET